MLLTLVIAYLLVTIAIGLVAAKRVKTSADFAIAGRHLPLASRASGRGFPLLSSRPLLASNSLAWARPLAKMPPLLGSRFTTKAREPRSSRRLWPSKCLAKVPQPQHSRLL